MSNHIEKLLLELDIISPDSIIQIHDRVRDSDRVHVNQCKKSGVIFLSNSDLIDSYHYEEMDEYSYWGADDRNSAIAAGLKDLDRRSELLKNIITNKNWLDVGSGVGGILDRLAQYANRTCAVEPQEGARNALKKEGYIVYNSIEDVSGNDTQVVTLFHVFEHLTAPLQSLKELIGRMESGGRIVIEVPHAKDFLISFLDHNAFKASTFWSEHLILHTRDSLRIFLDKAGFTNITVSGCQRYPLANHLHWLSKDKPGGHVKWDMLSNLMLDHEYENMLSRIDCNDTLIATGFKPNDD